MSEPFPLGATTAQGRLVLSEHLAGGPEQGLYLAVPSAAPDMGATAEQYLVATALLPEAAENFGAFATAALLLLVPGIAPLLGVMPLELPLAGPHTPAYPDLIALVERRPEGSPSQRWLPLPLPVGVALPAAVAVVRALGMAHSLGLAVGGIRPESIYIEGTAADFRVRGIAPRAERFWQMLPRPRFGIVPVYGDSYDPPEALRLGATPAPTPGGDIFALCTTLAFWLSGAHPFAAASLDQQWLAIQHGRRSAAFADCLASAAWPADLRAVLDRGLATDPAARPTAAEIDAALTPLGVHE